MRCFDFEHIISSKTMTYQIWHDVEPFVDDFPVAQSKHPLRFSSLYFPTAQNTGPDAMSAPVKKHTGVRIDIPGQPTQAVAPLQAPTPLVSLLYSAVKVPTRSQVVQLMEPDDPL